MSGQDINPFASPEDVNPFADSTSDLNEQQRNELANEFNPFAVQDETASPKPEKTIHKTTSTDTPSTPQTVYTQPTVPKSPATIEPTWATSPLPSRRPDNTGFKGYGTADDPMQQRQEELDRKAAELDKKEAELRKLADHGKGNNNFPPLPKFCCVGPCFYHDIKMDIPVEHQRSCRMLFFGWQFYVLTLFMNLISALGGLIEEAEDGALLFGVSLLYFLLFPIMSFVCWYRPIYKAFRSNSSFNFMMFFFVFGVQIIMMFIYALGINTLGTCGWINAAKVANANIKGVSIMYFLTAAMFTFLFLVYLYLFKRVHEAYRSSGASVQKAQKELAENMASNKSVQQAAVEGVAAGFSGNP